MRAVSLSHSRPNTNSRAIIASAIAVALTSVSPAIAAIATGIIREGETIAAGVTVTGIDAPASNGKEGYAFGTTQSDGLDRYFGNATGGARALLRTEGTVNGFVQTGFEGFFGFADNGSIAYGPTLSTPTRDCVWMDDTVCLNQLDPIPGQAGQFSVFNSDPNITYNGTPYWMGGFGPSGSTTNRALFKGVGASIVIKGGDAIPNAGLSLKTTISPFGNRMSGNGTHYIMNHEFAAPATTANDSFILVDGNMLMAGGNGVREGTAVPAAVGGLPGELWTNWDALAINEAGNAFFTGDTNAATTVDEFVFANNSIAMREGALVSTTAGPGSVSGDIEWADANETNDWAATWDVTVGTNREALIANGQVVLMEGDLVDWNGDGVIDAGDNNGKVADFTGIRAVTVGERYDFNSFFDVFVTIDIDFLGTVSTTDDLEGGFRIKVGVPEPTSISLIGVGAIAILRRRARKQ